MNFVRFLPALRRSAWVLVLAASSVTIAACSDDDDPAGPGPSPSGVSFAADVQPIFDASCAVVCHNAENPNGGLNLEAGASHSQLVGVASPNSAYGGMVRVVPGDLDASLLYQKITGNPATGNRMPLSGSLSAAQIRTIGDWIEGGALDD